MQEISSVKSDKWGYPVRTTSDKCIELLNKFYDQLLNYGHDKKIILQAAKEDENCANALASCFASGVDAQIHSDRYKQNLENATEYERAVIETLDVFDAEGDYDKAVSVHLKCLGKYPRDLATLKRAQILGFSRGRSDIMLQFASKVLHDNFDRAFMHGLLAFALVENGRVDEAEAAAEKALSIKNSDVWAQHAMCHVLQERQQFTQAISFMENNSGSWEECGSFLYSHNWWHLAVCHLEIDSLKNTLMIFDSRIWGNRTRAENELFMVSLNALGLLLCAEVKGYGDLIFTRVQEVAKCFLDESTWHKEWLLDLLVIWSLARCSYHSEAKRLISTLRSRLHVVGGSEQARETVLSLASAMYEYALGNQQVVSSLLGSTFNARELKVIGASNEQMRVFGQIWSKTTSLPNQLN